MSGLYGCLVRIVTIVSVVEVRIVGIDDIVGRMLPFVGTVVS